MNRAIFFDKVRGSLFGGKLTQPQVGGLNTLLDAFEREDLAKAAHQAYALATTFHETAQTMQPIREIGGNSYFKKMYDVAGERPKLARQNGNTQIGDGAKYCGRGYVQLTWYNNYAKAGAKIGVDLISCPDLAMEVDNAARILVFGMREGWFTGRKLSDYDKRGGGFDAVKARAIINGSDKAALIAGYHAKFLTAILAAA